MLRISLTCSCIAIASSIVVIMQILRAEYAVEKDTLQCVKILS